MKGSGSSTLSPAGRARRDRRGRGRLAVGLAVAPFEAATVLAWLAVLVGTSVDWGEYAAASVLVVLVGTLPLTPLRAFHFGRVPSAFLFLTAVALLRDSAGGLSSGVGILAFVPIFYVALYGSRRALASVIGGVVVFYLAPILLVGPPEYPHSQYRVALLSVTVGAIVGMTTQGLVRRVRRAAQESAEREQMLEQVNELVGRLFASPDARVDVCAAARRIGRATAAVLYEPGATPGSMRSTAMAGVETDPVEVPAGKETALTAAFASKKQVLVSEDVDRRVASARLWEAAGSPASILYEPLLRGSDAVGVLVVAWEDDAVRIAGPRVTVVSLLAHEAAAVIERADMVDQLATIAETDALTGLPNRRAWDARLASAAEDRRKFAVAILDMDHFKRFNDTFGHPAGDRLLKETAAAWRDEVRAGDVLARIGGEEFGLLLLDCDTAEAAEVVDRLRSRVTSGQTCSAGFAVVGSGEGPARVTARADTALYKAKRSGRDRVCVDA